MAKKKRPVTSPAALYRVEKRLTPKARAAFLRAVVAWQVAVAAGRLPSYAALRGLVAVTAEGTRLVGMAAAEVLGQRLGVTLRFDLTNPKAVSWAKENSARMIKDITDPTRLAVRAAIERSMAGEATAQDVARYVRSIVGLTDRQEQAVYKVYETALDQGLSKVDALAESQGYAEQLRKYRAEVIARTEVLMAENRGQELLWEQAKGAGMLKGLKRQWLATGDDRLCPSCSEMDGKITEIGKPWPLPPNVESMDGEPWVMTPQQIHCMCRCSQGLIEAP